MYISFCRIYNFCSFERWCKIKHTDATVKADFYSILADGKICVTNVRIQVMEISHLAIWACDIELLRSFYVKYFGMVCGSKYVNTQKSFTSYFLSFADSATRIELMSVPGLKGNTTVGNMAGLAHFAVSVGSREKVDRLTGRLRNDGYVVLGEPRLTGDGYYESVVADPEGNRVEITI